jgi:excisionase family DNA binding protein
MSENPRITDLIDKFVDGLPPFVTVKQAAEIRHCHEDHIYRLLGRGRLRAVKDGRKTLVETASLLTDLVNLPVAKIAMNARDRQRAAKSGAAKQLQDESNGRSATP